MWKQTACLASQKEKTPFAPAYKLQHSITHSVELAQFRSLYTSCKPYQRVILTSLSKTAASSCFMTALPTDEKRSLRMSDERWRLAMRHRLGLVPYDELQSESCLACCRGRRSVAEFRQDPDHFHACTQETRRSVNDRHNRIVYAVSAIAAAAGFRLQIEPPFPWVQPRSADHSRSHDTKSGDREHGDLLLTRANQRILIDVSVTRPTAASIRSAHRDVATTPLVAAAVVEKKKHNLYDAKCRHHGWTLVPFVMETYGGMGKEALKLLGTLSHAAINLKPLLAPHEFFSDACNAVSVALQSGNADVASAGCGRLWYQRDRAGVAPGLIAHHQSTDSQRGTVILIDQEPDVLSPTASGTEEQQVGTQDRTVVLTDQDGDDDSVAA